MNGICHVTEFIRDLTWESLPGEVREKIKICLLDALGAIISGNEAAVTAVACRFAEKIWPGAGESTILTSNRKMPVAGAAFVNACAANALDIDDDGKYTEGHPGAQIIPAALAMAEKKGASGKRALTSMVIGYEVAHRTGRCWHDAHEEYQACGSWGAVATAAVASHLLGLETPAIEQALGIAEYFAPNLPMMRDIDHPAMVKHGIGWGTMTGIMAAELASEGFTGIPSILGFENYRQWVTDIGDDYLMVEGVTFKRYASCLWGHPPIPAMIGLLQQHGIDVNEIEKITIHGFHEMVRLGTRLPETEEQAQFSVAWPLAALLIEEVLGPQQMLKKRFGDPAITDLAGRIEVVESEEMNRLYNSTSYPCRVNLQLKDGRCFDSGVVSYSNSSPGEMENEYGDLWRPEDVREKFARVCHDIVETDVIEGCMELVDGFDRLEDISSLPALLKGSLIHKRN